MTALVLAFFIFYLALTLRRLDWAVMFLIAVLPSYLIRFKIFGVPMTVLEIMILTVFVVWFSKNWKMIADNLREKFKTQNLKLRTIYDYPFRWEIVLLLVISLASVGMAGFTDAAFGIWKAYFLEPILFYIVLFNMLVEKKDATKLILYPLLVSALSVSLLAVYQKITGQLIDNPLWAAQATRRVVSFFGYPNAVGLYLAPLIILFVGWAKSEQDKKRKTIILVSVLLSLLSIVFAKSIGAFLGVAAGLTIFSFAAGKKSRMAVIGLYIAAAILVPIFQPTRQLVYKYLTLNDFSGQVRKSQWDETWKMLKDGRIITGAGLANYQKAVAPYHHAGIWIVDIFDKDWLSKQRTDAAFRQKVWQPLEIFLYPHNILLNFWSELGLAGMILFIWIIAKFCYLALNNKNNLTLGLIGSVAAIAVQGLVDVPYFKNDLSVEFWIPIALLGYLVLQNKTPQPLRGAGREATARQSYT